MNAKELRRIHDAHAWLSLIRNLRVWSPANPKHGVGFLGSGEIKLTGGRKRWTAKRTLYGLVMPKVPCWVQYFGVN